MSDDTTATDTQVDEQTETTETNTDSMTPEQQIEHWKSVAQAARRAEDRAKGKNSDPTKSAPYLSKQLAAAQKELEDLRKAGMSQAEKDLQLKFDEGRQTAQAEALLKFGGQLVAAEARGMLAGRGLEAERVAAIVEHLAPAKYLGDDGNVDTAALTTFIDAIAPKQQSTGTVWSSADFGQGRREAPASVPGAGGAAEAAKRFGKKTA